MSPAILMASCAAVADPTRLLLLYLLGTGPKSVGQLVEPAHVTQSSVSYHVERLRQAGLVGVHREGRRTIVRRNERRWAEIVSALGGAW
jgi:DNA-binding transcriptional ArsR family regulator